MSQETIEVTALAGTAGDEEAEPALPWYSRYAVPAVAVGFGALLLGLWQFLVSAAIVSPVIMPSPGEVVDALVEGLIGGTWWKHVGVTMQETVVGFLIGTISAIVIGSLLALSAVLRKGLYPYVLMAQSFPKLAIAPILVTWLGYGMTPKVVIAALLAFFPVFVNTVAGLREVRDNELDLLRSLNASFWQELKHLRLPNAMSYIFPALTLAAVNSLLGAIVGEFVGASSGLGYLIIQKSFLGDIASVYGVLLVLAAIGVSLFGILRFVEGRTRFRKC